MMGSILSCYLDLQEGSLPAACHVNVVKPSGNTWAEANWKAQSGRLWSDFRRVGSGPGEKLLV